MNLKQPTESNAHPVQNERLVPEDSSWLILVPTKFELDVLANHFPIDIFDQIEICGFGSIVPAARTAELIHSRQPSRVLLIGIAGAYSNENTSEPPSIGIGQAVLFSHVACYGIGAGSAGGFQTAGQMGWQHWHGDLNSVPIGDEIELQPMNIDTEIEPINRTLITVTSASSTNVEVAEKLKRFPNAIAEDMEGFAVASACQLSKIPLTIVRGMSNKAGDRNKANWKIKEALVAVAKLVQPILQAQS